MALQVWRPEEDTGFVLHSLLFFFLKQSLTEFGPRLGASKPQPPPVSTLHRDGGIDIHAATTNFLPEC